MATNLEQIVAQGGPVAEATRKFVESAAVFLSELAQNNITLDIGPSDSTENKIDYSAPTLDSYRKTYKPISATEIIEANKKMTEAISGEKWFAGFMTAVQLIMMFRP